MSKKIYKYGLTAMGGTILVSAMIATAIANRGIPYHSDQEMRDARINYEFAMSDYGIIFDQIISDAKQEFITTPEYQNIISQMNKIDEWNSTYEILETRLDSLKGEFINDSLTNNQDLKYCDIRAQMAYNKYAKLQRDSTIATEMKRVPFKTRLKNNWNDIKCEYHNKQIQQHQARLKQLQRTK